MVIVSDTSIITNLIQLGQLSLLEKLYGEIILPEKVLDELAKVSGQVEIVKDKPWITIKAVSDQVLYKQLEAQLDPGESEAIALAIGLKSDLLLIDERKGRIIARQHGLLVTGLIGILIEAKSEGYIKYVKPMMDRLILEIGFWIGPNLYQEVLKVVNEK